MKKDEVLKYVESQGDVDFIVRTEAEDKTFLENYGKKIEEEQIPSKISELHNRYDEDIFSVTGQRKNPTEKTYEFTKRILGDLKTKAEKAEAIEAEITRLKQQIKEGGNDKLLLDLENMKKAYKELEETKTSEIKRINTDFEKYKIQNELLSASSGLNFKKGIPEAATKALLNQAISELLQIASRQEDKLVFLNKDGAPLRNAHNALNPYTAEELLKEKLKDVIETGKKAEGGPDLNKEIVKEYDKTGKLTKIALVIPDSVKSKVELSEYLVKSGLLRGTQEYHEAYKEYSKALPFA